MSKRQFSLLAIALGFAVTTAGQSQASYTIQTSITGVSDSAGAVTGMTLAQGYTFTAGASVVTIGLAGGSEYTDTAGTMVYFVNDNKTPSVSGVVNEQIFVLAAATVNDSSTFSFTELTAINGAPAFTLAPDSIRLDIVSGGDQNYYDTAGTITPTTFYAAGVNYTASSPKSTDGNVNSQNNGTFSLNVTSSVPEPASIAMLGLGLAGAGGFAAIRRRRAAK